MQEVYYIHATSIIIRDKGLLIRGQAGMGKTRLALSLIEAAHNKGHLGALVGDDRTGLISSNSYAIMQGHPDIAGQAERRGLGIMPLPYEKRALLHLVIDLLPELPARLPDTPLVPCEIMGLAFPCFSVYCHADITHTVSDVFYILDHHNY